MGYATDKEMRRWDPYWFWDTLWAPAAFGALLAILIIYVLDVARLI